MAHGGYKLAGPRGTRRPPARMHALGPGSGNSGGGPSMLATLVRSRSRAPTASRSPRFSQVPMVASPIRKSHSESFVRQTRGPALGTAPARGPWGSVIQGPRGATRPPECTHALEPGTGKSGGGPSACNPATLPLKSPSRIAFTPLQSGAHGRVSD